MTQIAVIVIDRALAFAFPNACLCGARPLQQRRQIDQIILSTSAPSRSMAGLMPRGGPFWGPLPTPFDESAVPNESVPGAAGLVPKAGGDGHPRGQTDG
jgi:hypothetical protein